MLMGILGGGAPAATTLPLGTLNPSDKSAAAVLSEGNVRITGAAVSGTWYAARAATPLPADRASHFCAQVADFGSNGMIAIGLASEDAALTFGGENNKGASYFSDGRTYHDGNAVSYAGYGLSDLVDVWFDPKTGRVWLGRNGASLVGSPISGVSPYCTLTPGVAYYPMISVYNTSSARLVSRPSAPAFIELT